MAKVRFQSAGETLYAYLAGEIDHDSAQNLREQIERRVDQCMPTLLVIDMAGICFMDSSGVGLILGRQRQMQANGGSLRVDAPPVQIQKILRLAHIAYQEVGR